MRGKSNCFLHLPFQSTHLLQPIDVAFFRPLKSAWRSILEKRKKVRAANKRAFHKILFHPLKQLTSQTKSNSVANLIAGFEKSGLVSLNKNKVIDHHPYDANLENPNGERVTNEGVSESDASFLELLKEMGYGNGDQEETKRKRKIDFAPGKSITGADFVEAVP